jgi:hypothetical protein
MPPLDIRQAVSDAVDEELRNDGFDPNTVYDKKMSELGYDIDAMTGFLNRVKRDLGKQGLIFTFDSSFVDNAVNKTPPSLKAAITVNTTVAVPAMAIIEPRAAIPRAKVARPVRKKLAGKKRPSKKRAVRRSKTASTAGRKKSPARRTKRGVRRKPRK